MNQLTKEQQERVRQIRERHLRVDCYKSQMRADIDFLLSLYDSQTASNTQWSKRWPNSNGGVYWRRFVGHSQPSEPELCILNGDYLDSFGGASTMSIPSEGLAEQWEFFGPLTPDSISDAATLMRDKCVKKVKGMRDQNNRNYEYWKSIASDPDHDFGVLKLAAWAGEDERVIAALESLTLDTVEQEK